MKENGMLGQSTIDHLASQRGQKPEEVAELANYMCGELGLKKSRVYQLLSEGYGIGKPHFSGKYEDGEIIDKGGKQMAMKKQGAHSIKHG